jgi:hypothetical protein
MAIMPEILYSANENAETKTTIVAMRQSNGNKSECANGIVRFRFAAALRRMALSWWHV